MATEYRERAFPFTLTRSADTAEGDGLTFGGYAAVFNKATHIEERDGSEFDEVIAPGAFRQAINSGRKPVFMFNHGKHPLIGPMPLGTITDWREDDRGLWVEARLSDNWLISPVRDAIADGAITGMSFRFEAIKESWTGKPNRKCRNGELRTVKEVRCPELGPVVTPAYDDTTAMVRSAFRDLQVEGLAVTVTIQERAAMTPGMSPSMDSGDMGDCEITTWDEGVQEQLVDAIGDLWGLGEIKSNVHPLEMLSDGLTFYVEGEASGVKRGLWRVPYTLADGQLSIGTPEQVGAVVGAITTTPTPPVNDTDPNNNRSDMSEELGTSTEAATSTSTEAAVAEARTREPLNTPAARERFLREIELRRRGVRVGATT